MGRKRAESRWPGSRDGAGEKGGKRMRRGHGESMLRGARAAQAGNWRLEVRLTAPRGEGRRRLGPGPFALGSSAVELAILARHAESEFSVRGAMNGDPASPAR